MTHDEKKCCHSKALVDEVRHDWFGVRCGVWLNQESANDREEAAHRFAVEELIYSPSFSISAGDDGLLI